MVRRDTIFQYSSTMHGSGMLPYISTAIWKKILYIGILICALFSLSILIQRTLEKEKIKEEHRRALARIICTEEDLVDTPFITKLKKSDVITLPDKATLQILSREELSFLYHRYVESLQYFCSKIIRVGHITDGGWDVCEERKFLPLAPCLIYSFGINFDFSFDDAAIERYGCEVHSFDPSMDIESFQRRKLNYYHNIGLSPNDSLSRDGWRLMRLSSIKSMLGHEHARLNVLKIDIETMEWGVLREMLSHNGLADIDNLLVEFHMNVKWPPTEEDRPTYLRHLLVLKDLYDVGFRIFWTHRNIQGRLLFKSKCKGEERANCHEINFVRLKDSS